jgi:hypothetical protein
MVTLALMMLVVVATQPATGAAPHRGCPRPYSISYDYAGLTSIRISNGHFRYMWHTPTDDPRRAMEQSLNAYDSHLSEQDLSTEQEARVIEWLESAMALGLRSPDGNAERPSYGGAFRTSFSVSCGDVVTTLHWTGDSRWSDTKMRDDLSQTVSRLQALCDTIAKGAAHD